jgi:hypothetical protein
MAEKDGKPGQPTNHDAAEPGMSRRRMLGFAGAGAAGLAAGAFAAASPARAAATRLGPPQPDTRARPVAQPDSGQGAGRVPPGEPVIVHVANAHSGEVSFYAGTSHIRVHDPALAAKLRRAAG